MRAGLIVLILLLSSPAAACPALSDPGRYAKDKNLRFVVMGKDGWLFRSKDFKADYAAQARTLSYFSRLAAELKARGTALVAVVQPARAVMAESRLDARPKGYDARKALLSYRAFLKQLEGAGIVAPDLSGMEKDGGYFMARDSHWSRAGAAFSAEQVARALDALPQMKDVPRMDFETTPTGKIASSQGYLGEFVQATCGTDIAPEEIPLFATAKVADDAAALLGDEAAPDIVLLGTSNAAGEEKYGFAGGLSRLARADVYNAAVSGGGFGSAAVSYFSSGAFRARAPKIVVWEFLSHHDVNAPDSRAALRQMIPAAHGPCAPGAALASYAGDEEMFRAATGRPLPPSFVYIEADAPPKLDVLYADGGADRVDFTRDRRAGDEGKYFFDLQAGEAPVMFRVAGAKVSARLCPYGEGQGP